MEIAAYRLLERVAGAAGDRATAEVAHRILDQEIAMAERLADHFDDAVDASLAGKSLEDMESSLDAYLDDVHAIETQAAVVLPAAERFVEDAALAGRFSDRMEHVRRDRTRVEGRIAERGSSRSAMKDAALAAGGLGIDGFFGVQPDRGLKIVGFMYAFEHLKVAAYELLARVAGRVDDTDTLALARRLSGDADLMASHLEAWMGQAEF
jgi:ferritin-like metal-binding protein YciE